MAFLVFATEEAAETARAAIGGAMGASWAAPAPQDDGTWFLPQPAEPFMAGVVGQTVSVAVRPVGVSTTLVPAQVTNFQARAVMRQVFLPNGRSMFSAVDAQLRGQRDAAAALPESDPQRIQADTAWQAWEQANDYTRDGLLVQQLGASFGMTAADLDALFIQAAGISA